MPSKRILWLFNHTSLRKFEVPLLIEMGYEVYCPKIFDVDFGDFSASISDQFDSSLSIPQEDLKKLNKTNFYTEFDEETTALVNKYFDIAFCMFHMPTLNSLATCFRGVLLLHAFGLDNDLYYTDVLYNSSPGLFEKLDRMGERFFFAPTYDNIADIECELFRRRSVLLPIGMDSSHKKEWSGGDEKFLFISPKIKTNSFYEKVYKDFKKNFGDLPHVIGGAQPQPVTDDDCVTGFLSDEEYNYNMTRLCAMFYHSQKLRYLYYHPLEAIDNGMPLVFMAGGMLDHLGGSKLPGCCKSIAEARKKLKRLAKGDKRLIEAITSSQQVLLQSFTYEFCQPYWQKGMAQVERSLANAKAAVPKKKRIAVIMPAPYLGGILDYSICFALCLQSQIKKNGDLAELVFAYPDKEVFKRKDYFAVLRQKGIPTRSFALVEKDSDWVRRTLTLAGYASENSNSYIPPKVSAFNDGMAGFSDCDYAVFTADAGTSLYPFFMTIPHAIVAHDYIQRYVPGVIAPAADDCKISNQRQADAILVTSTPTYEDALAYGGIAPERLWLVPHLFAVNKGGETFHIEDTGEVEEQLYFMWPTNAAPHKNHLITLSALEEYYLRGGKLDCVITGTNTKIFSKDTEDTSALVSEKYIKRIKDKIYNSSALTQHIRILGNLSPQDYKNCLAKAAFLLHPAYGDNGTFSVIDAAAVKTPSLCSDYPAMRYLADFAGLELQYTDAFDSSRMAQALLDMEKNHMEYARRLPDYEELSKNAYEEKAAELYSIVKLLVGI